MEFQIDEYTEQDLAKFSAYLDIQQEEAEFYLPIEDSIIELTKEEIEFLENRF